MPLAYLQFSNTTEFANFLTKFLLAGLSVVLLTIVLGFLWNLSRGTWRRPSQPAVRYQATPLMTSTELVFFKRLHEAAPDLVVAPQVAMSGLVTTAQSPGPGKSAFVHRAAFSQKRLDFVVFDPISGEVIVVI